MNGGSSSQHTHDTHGTHGEQQRFTKGVTTKVGRYSYSRSSHCAKVVGSVASSPNDIMGRDGVLAGQLP